FGRSENVALELFRHVDGHDGLLLAGVAVPLLYVLRCRCVGDADQRLRRQCSSGVGCAAAILSRSCPLWVKSGHHSTSASCPLYPQKWTLIGSIGMSALCRKRTSLSTSFCTAFRRSVSAETSPFLRTNRQSTRVFVLAT